MIKLRFLPTLFMLPVLMVLVGLGTWQLDRLAWKEGLIAEIEARVMAAPAPLMADEALKAAAVEDVRYMRVEARGTYDHAREVRLHAVSATDGAGWTVLTPLQRADGGWIVVARGFVTPAQEMPDMRPASLLEGSQTIEGLLREPGGGNSFTPAANQGKRRVYAVDMAQLEALMGFEAGTLPPVFLEATHDNGGIKGGQTPLALKNDHLEYALTWYGLALTLLGVYIAYHIMAAREAAAKKD